MRFGRKTARNAVLAGAVTAALSSSSIGLAADRFWDGPSNNFWTTATNWSGGEPGTTDAAVFDGNGTVQRNLVVLNANRQVGQMRVTGVPSPGAYKFVSEGGVLTATDALTIKTGAASVAFQGFRVNTGLVLVEPSTTLNLVSNAQVTAGLIDVVGGTLNWNSGSITTTGTGGFLIDGGQMNVSAGGRGLANATSLQVFNGGHFTSNNYFDIGSSADVGNGPTGTLSVSGTATYQQTAGPGSFWSFNLGDVALVNFHDQAVGTLATGLGIGNAGGSAVVTVDGSARLQIDQALNVGVVPAALSVAGGRSIAHAPRLDGGQSANGTSSANVFINIDGSATFETAGTAAFGAGSKVNLINGTMRLGGDSTFSTGGELRQTGGSFSIAANKTFNINGGTVSVLNLNVQNGTTTRVTDGGKLTATDFLHVASGGGNGTLLVDSTVGTSTVTVNSFTPSNWGAIGQTANVTISNHGLVHVKRLNMAQDGGNAVVNLLSDGELEVEQLFAAIGTTPTSTVAINVDGGVFSPTTAVYGTNTAVNFSNGVVAFGGSNDFLDGSIFNWTGGTLVNLPGTVLAFDGGVGSFNNTFNPNVTMSDGSLLRIDEAGTLRTIGAISIANGQAGAPTGTMLVNELGSSITSTATGAAGFSEWSRITGDKATITFSSSGVGSFNAGLRIGELGGAALVNISGSARLNAASLIAGTNGVSDGVQINVAGGILATTGAAQLRNGVTVNYSSGSLGIGGPLLMSGNAQMLLTSGGNKVLRARGLDMGSTSKIDLADNDMIVGNLTTKSAVEALVRTGRNNGAWNGTPGITSSAAKNHIPKNTTLGVLSGAEFTSVGGSGTFSGEPYVATDTLIKYTWYGDTDFNGVVNFDDYSRTDAGFNQHRTGWLNGDFDYNGVVNFDDYSLIDLAFNTQSGSLREALGFLEGGGGSNSGGMNTPALHQVALHYAQFGEPYAAAFIVAVPEPTTSCVLISLGGAALVTRRRRGC